MKKFIIIIICTLSIISIISVFYIYETRKLNEIKYNNKMYEKLLEQEITGIEMASLINKTIDKNNNNDIKLNKEKKYINDNKISINIDIKFKDNENKFPIYKIYKHNIENFLKLYKNIKFKCIKIEYHKNKNVKYLYFEEI